jgi:hypothetical protein
MAIKSPPNESTQPPKMEATLAELSVKKLVVSATDSPQSMAESVLNLRVDQNFSAELYGAPVLASVQIARPPKPYFLRTQAGDACSTTLYTLDAGKQGGDGIYACSAAIAALVPDQVRLVQIRLAVTSQGVPYLIPVSLPGPDGRWNAWHQSLARALEIAESTWVRISANTFRGGYDIFKAVGTLPEPKWPTETFDELLEIGFRGRLITTESHHLVQQLLGAV